MLVSEVDELLQDEPVEEEAGHFQVGVCDVTVWVVVGFETVLDVLGPFDAPDDGEELFCSTEPGAAGSSFRCVDVSDVGGGAGDQFCALCGAFAQLSDEDEDAPVQEALAEAATVGHVGPVVVSHSADDGA
jgi:hypothetical protein